MRVDTLRIKDTTIIAEVQKDTTFLHIPSNDTMFITKDRLEIKYFNNGKTVYIEGKCKGDTIYKDILVPVNKIIVEEGKSKWYDLALRWIFIIVAGLILLWLARKFLL